MARAQPLSDIGEVASLLLSNQKRKEAQEDTEPVRESDAERHRRLARMKALKAELNQEPETTTTILVCSCILFFFLILTDEDSLKHFLWFNSILNFK